MHYYYPNERVFPSSLRTTLAALSLPPLASPPLSLPHQEAVLGWYLSLFRVLLYCTVNLGRVAPLKIIRLSFTLPYLHFTLVDAFSRGWTLKSLINVFILNILFMIWFLTLQEGRNGGQHVPGRRYVKSVSNETKKLPAPIQNNCFADIIWESCFKIVPAHCTTHALDWMNSVI